MPSRIPLVATLATTVALTAGLTVAQATPSAQSGIGDPYFPRAGNPGYDVRHYGIDVRYRPGSRELSGETTIRLKSKQRLAKFNLDLVLHADRVWVNGRRAVFGQTPHELTIKPRHPIRAGKTVSVRVRYHGKPLRAGHEHPVERTHTGIIAIGEPDIAAWWFPSNDHPSDKATYDIALTVPAGYEAISNGILVGDRTAAGLTRWRWSVSDPMATFLAFAAFGQYDIEQGRAGGRPFLYAWEQGLGAQAQAARASMRFTPDAVRFLSRVWGPYPFEAIGGVVTAATIGYALENQTRPVYGRDFFLGGAARYVVIHEMAHQWFGDRVSLRRWRDIWLSEGFATYSEWLWDAHQGGVSPQQQLMRRYRLFERGNPFWALRIGDPGPNRLFDDAVYYRGAMTVQALRNRVGGKDFLTIAHRWTHGRDGVGSTSELQRLAQRVSGEQLDGFFHNWLYVGAKPRATAANGL